MIFTMHLNVFGDFKKFSFSFQLLARWGVPFFFIASSFFLFSKCENSNNKWAVMRSYFRRIFSLYLVWLIINSPSVLFSICYKSNFTNLKAWLYLLKGILLSSTFTGSWYLTGCAFCAFAIYLLCKKCRTSLVVLLSFTIEIICILSSSYYGLLPFSVKKIVCFLNFPLNIFSGMFYFALGKWFAENKMYISKISTKICALLAIIFYVLYFKEIYFTKKAAVYLISDQAFLIIPASVFIFLFALNSKITVKNSRLLRKISTVIYCAQGNILLFSSIPSKLLMLETRAVASIIGYALMTAAVLLVLRLQKSGKFSWAKYLS